MARAQAVLRGDGAHGGNAPPGHADEGESGVRSLVPHTLRTWLDDPEPGQDHANVDALIGRIEALAATAADIDDGFDD
jgi:hypothetical protein